MIFKNQKPYTPSQRHLIKLKIKHTRKKPLIKSQIIGKKNISGRNNSGKITIHHKGGGHKKKYRKIKFEQTNESTGIVISIEYDPNRNSNIASIYDFFENYFFYIIAPKNLRIGDIIRSGLNVEPNLGNTLPISEIPVGSFIYNISPVSLKPAQISRAAGTFSVLTEKSFSYAKIEISSGEQRLISPKCYATIGIVSNEQIIFTTKGKAGRSRWLNKRPTVRGVAMNPVDHPHGGGEGRAPIGRSGPVTPWGKPALGVKTRKRNKPSNRLIVRRRR
jgi:large subunit ribosomal protein L2